MKPGGSKLGLRTVAVIEAAKGLLVLIVGVGLPGITQHRTHILLERIVKSFRLNPAHKVPRIFAELAHRLDNTHVWVLAVCAGGYALIRFAEAYGLWRGRRWAEWVGCVGAALYVPVEIAHLMKHHSWITYWILVVNILLVIYLAGCLITGRKKKTPPASPEPAEV
jgi:uncharacterized membrane protein (DUF2068 family)